MKDRFRSDAILLITAIIWGSAFAAQRVAAQYLGPFLFNGLRFLLAGLLLLPFARLPQQLNRKNFPWVAAAGSLLFVSSALQQAGLATTSAGNAGFITSLYVVLVPLLLLILWRKHSHWLSWVAAGVAVIGAWLLSSGGQSLKLAPGDSLELMGALGWSFHVIVVSKGSHKIGALAFSVGQCLVAAVLNLIVGFSFEAQTLPGIANAWWAVAYVAIFSTAVGYTLQIVGQRHSPPTDASIIMSLESVFAAFFGFLLLGEKLGPAQLLGCGLIFGAVVLAQAKGEAASPL
jgi:drug/metabolite transporter (DMT)-like permease